MCSGILTSRNRPNDRWCNPVAISDLFTVPRSLSVIFCCPFGRRNHDGNASESTFRNELYKKWFCLMQVISTWAVGRELLTAVYIERWYCFQLLSPVFDISINAIVDSWLGYEISLRQLGLSCLIDFNSTLWHTAFYSTMPLPPVSAWLNMISLLAYSSSSSSHFQILCSWFRPVCPVLFAITICARPMWNHRFLRFPPLHHGVTRVNAR